MTFEADLRTHLLGEPAIAAAIADQASNETRLWPNERPQDNERTPAIVYLAFFGTPAANLEGDDGQAAGALENVRTQIDVWGKTFDEARALALLVIARMAVVSADKSIRSVRISRQSDVDPETREHREILEFSVWHSPQ